MHIDLNQTRKSIPNLTFEYSEEYNVVYVSTLSKSHVEIVSKQMAEKQLAKVDLPAQKRQIYQRVLEEFVKRGR